MTSISEEINSKLISFLKTRAPNSMIERGIALAAAGNVSECARSGSKVQGIVNDESQEQFSASLHFLSDRNIEGACSCSAPEDMQEQWCMHAVALCLRSHELGFFEPQSGFVSQEATFRLNSSTPEQIAEVVSKLSEPDTSVFSEGEFYPQVSIYLRPLADQLAVRVFFDGQPQSPTPFEGMRQISARSLDNVLLAHLEEDGSWDEQNHCWLLSASRAIEHVIGLSREYKGVFLLGPDNKETVKAIEFSKQALDAHAKFEWRQSSLELSFNWVLPDRHEVIKTQELVGTGPYWVMLENVWYRVSQKAVLLASIFPYTSQFTLARSQVGPILEVLNSGLLDTSRILIRNAALQPKVQVLDPQPNLSVAKVETQQEHFSSREALEIQAELTFNYPEAPTGENIVYLPNRDKEREHREQLSRLGFVFNTNKKQYFARGEAVLDFLSEGHKTLEQPWTLQGIDQCKKGVRFAELTFNISLGSSTEREKKKASRNIDWFDCQVTLTQNNTHIPISALFKQSRPEEERWIKLETGAYAKIPGGSLSHLKTTFGILDANFKLSNQIKTRLSAAQALSISILSDPQFKIQLDKKLQKLSERLQTFSKVEGIEASKNFKGTLRPYQVEGLSWLNFLGEMELGGILADEMGLGKTVQAIALLQYSKDTREKDSTVPRPTLVVAPTSVITNWRYEIERFAPKLKCILIHGPGRKKLFSEVQDADVVITSYALLRLDRSELERCSFNYVILDEAQNIKNPEAATTKSSKALKAQRRLALTGTPTENRPLELWSIMDFLMPGYLGSHDYFKNYIERPILEIGGEAPATRFLQRKTKPFILRRRKNEVERDLPAKTESLVYVQMTESQRQVYNRILEEVRPQVFNAIKDKGVAGASISILAALLRLRQICNHPYSIEALKGVANLDSGKFNQLKELVTEAHENGRKILLFSQFREMLSLIRIWLDSASVSHLYLDGATRDRQSLIDRFNSDESVRLFLISLKAGGTGLNLTAADTVIIYDPWWNPAVENQAVDRAHRIGQTKPVSVYRLVTEDSVERKIMDLKAKKSRINSSLIDGEDGLSVGKLSRMDLESLFSPLPVED